jgi:Alpha-kinase family
MDDSDEYHDDMTEKIELKDGEVAQAFSHFSYVFGGRKSLICDLQGVFQKQKSLLCFTDPVIHYHDPQNDTKRGQYGKTDRGAKGIEDFLNTHTCNALCDLVTTGYFECANAVDV